MLKISNLAAKLDETEGEEKMGQQGLSTNELWFDNCRLHREAVPEKLNDGYNFSWYRCNRSRIPDCDC